MNKIYIFLKIFILLTICFFSFLKKAYCFEFYEVNEPYRNELDKKYQYNNIDDEDLKKKELDLSDIKHVYLQKKNNLFAEEKDVENKTKLDEKINSTKRPKFGSSLFKKNTNSSNSNGKSWVEDWFPDTKIKPMQIVGAYTSFKLALMMPMDTKISAKETIGYSGEYYSTQLFTGKAKYFLTPAFFIDIGNDKFKWWRWEVELGYLPLLARNTGEPVSSNSMSEYTFVLSRKDLSIHLLSLSFNNFLQHDFLDKNLVGFVGLGLGVGYAWSFGNKLSSDFVMPIATGYLGISFVVGKKSKVNIAYTMTYSRISLPNKYQFDRVDSHGRGSGDRAIQGGSVKFSELLINGFSIEYMFYTS